MTVRETSVNKLENSIFELITKKKVRPGKDILVRSLIGSFISTAFVMIFMYVLSLSGLVNYKYLGLSAIIMAFFFFLGQLIIKKRKATS